MFPHFSIHCGRKQNGRPRGKSDRGKRVASQAVREFGDDVCRRRRDQEQVPTVGEVDVTGTPAFLLVIEARGDGIFGKRLQGER